jgi:hypothetical protein
VNKLVIDAFGQIIYNSGYTYSQPRGILDMSYYGFGIDNSSNMFYLQGIQSPNTFNYNQMIVNSNASIGIGTESPCNYIHIDVNYKNNLDIPIQSMIGLYSSTECNISYIQGIHNGTTLFDISSNGNFTIGNIPIINKYNIDVSSNIRTPELLTDLIYCKNNNSNISFSNLTLYSSNIITSNMTITNYLDISSLQTLNTSGILSSSNLTLIKSSSNIFADQSITIDPYGIPISTSYESVKIIVPNYTTSLPISPYSLTGVGLNITAPTTYRGSARVSSTKGYGSLIEFYNYNQGTIYPNINTNVWSFGECGIRSYNVSGGDGDAFYIDYNELNGTNQTGALLISKNGLRLQHSLQINGYNADNVSTGKLKYGYVGIGLGGTDENPNYATSPLQVAGEVLIYPRQLSTNIAYSSAVPTLYCDTNSNVVIGGKANVDKYNLLVYGTSCFIKDSTFTGNVGIGTTDTLIDNHQYSLAVQGDAHVSGNVLANNLAVPSDIRVKYNITKIKDSVNKLKNISGYYYNRNDIVGNPKETGCIAQEVKLILPEVVNDIGDTLSISYGNMTGILIEAIKELDQRLSIIEHNLNLS